MERRHITIWLAAGLFLAVCLCFLGQGKSWARGDRMIYIYGSGEGDQRQTSLEPDHATVGRETRVIWANESDTEIQVIFQQGKACELATYGTLGWKVKDRCYITDKSIPPGGTTSAVFSTIGVYEYEILFVGKEQKLKGTIAVGSQPGYPPR